MNTTQLLSASDQQIETVRIAVVGSGGVGKSSITTRFLGGNFFEKYDPTIEDIFEKVTTLENGKRVKIVITDTAGQEEFIAFSEAMYHKQDAFLIVFSLVDEDTINELPRFATGIARAFEDVPIAPVMLLAGNKVDLVSSEAERSAIEQQVRSVWGNAVGEHEDILCCDEFNYLPTSAKDRLNIDEVFDALAQSVVTMRESMSPSSSPQVSPRGTAAAESKKPKKKKKNGLSKILSIFTSKSASELSPVPVPDLQAIKQRHFASHHDE